MSNPRDDEDDEYDEYDEEELAKLEASQARRNRIRWERDFLRAKKIIIVNKDGRQELRLIYIEKPNFEV